MAITNKGILGGVSGKVGQVVGGSWKGIDYVRSYVVPADPQTELQMNQRAKFYFAKSIASFLLTSIIQPFWAAHAVKMSSFNAFLKYNINKCDSETGFTTNNVISKGTLQSNAISNAIYDHTSGIVEIIWINDNYTSARTTDNACVVAVLKNGSYAWSATTGTMRGDPGDNPSMSLSITKDLDDTDILVYLFFTRGTGKTLMVSNSTSRALV